MIIIYGMVFAGYILLFFLSHKNKGKTPFDKAAEYLFRRLYKKKAFGGKQVSRNLALLNPSRQGEEQYYLKKIRRLLLMLFLGNFLASVFGISSQCDSSLIDGKYIERNPFGLGSKEAALQAQIETGETKEEQEFLITVEERKFEAEMVEKMSDKVKEILPEVILGENSSLEEVRKDLYLPKQIQDYPFHIAWESDDYSLVYCDGSVINEDVEEGRVVNLTAILSYEDFSEEYVFPIHIFPPWKTEAESIQEKIYGAIEQAQKTSRKKGQLTLPDKVDEMQIKWSERKEDSSRYLFLLAGIASIAVYLLQDKDLQERVEARNRQMLLDYPGIITKLVLYMGAGMTMRNAFRKIAGSQAAGKQKYIYEEMRITCYELDSGISESIAYENFGRRCRLIPYTRLSGLLVQNLKKGSSSILEALRKEADTAFEERKNMAKKLGEEAGTKLLLPMILMLGIVMLLIIVPAYFSFSI